MSHRIPEESKGEPASETFLTQATAPARHGEGTAKFDVKTPREPEVRDQGVHEEVTRLREENAQLHQALQSRTVIGQATGMLMAAMGLTPDQAFALLSRMSSCENRKLRDVAATLVAAATASKAQGAAPPDRSSGSAAAAAKDRARAPSPSAASHSRPARRGRILIPVVAPPLDEPPARLRWFRIRRETEGGALQHDQLAQLTDDPGGDCAPSSRSSRTLLHRRGRAQRRRSSSWVSSREPAWQRASSDSGTYVRRR